MRILDKKAKYEIENQVINKMFRDKRFRTRKVERNHKYKELEHESKKDIRGRWKFGVQYEPWEA